MSSPVVLPKPQSLPELVGREIAVSDWRPVTQERILQFAEATGDQQWIHTDGERARRDSPYGATVAHGFLTLSLLPQLLQQAIQIKQGVRLSINYGLNRVRFPAPVKAGARIRARFVLQSARELPGGMEVTFGVTVEVEGEQKPGCIAEWMIRHYY